MRSFSAIPRQKTALTRTALSRPLKQALEDGLLTPDLSVFDYGCGRGGDLERLRALQIRCDGWDPAFRPDAAPKAASLVNLGYVVNVIEAPLERAETLRRAWSLTERLLVVSARLQHEARDLEATEAYEDGLLTRTGTFQKFYDQQELKAWIDLTLEVRAVPAGPGIYYVFRDEDARQSFLASRFRRRIALPRLRRADVLFESHRTLLEPLMEFFAWRGRLPEADELPEAQDILAALGSIKRAFRVVREATLAEEWERIADARAQELLVHLALLRFEGLPTFGQLPETLQRDIRALFSSYQRAAALSEVLLFSAGQASERDAALRSSPIGKYTGSALYVHVSALEHLPPLLRVYEGCARAVVGNVEGATLIKLHRDKPQLSYLTYPDFERDPHPALKEALLVPLQTFRLKLERYDSRANPPILHRKETFVAPDHPLREKFARLTAQEERFGLFDAPSSIGTRAGWERVLQEKGVKLHGHRVVRG